MDSILCYQPHLASFSQSSLFPRTVAPAFIAPQPLASTAAVGSVGSAGNDTHRNSQRNYWEDQNRTKAAKTTDLAPKGRLPGQPIKQGNSREAGNYLSDDDDEFPTLQQLVANADKKRILANIKPSIGQNVNSRIQDNSPVCRSGSAPSSCQDPIWISDDESDTASQIDSSDLGPDSTPGAECHHQFYVDKGLEGGEALSSETTSPSNRPAGRNNDETNKNHDVIHNVQLQPSTAGYKSSLASHPARELQRNTKVTTDVTEHASRKDPNDPENYVFNVFAEEDERDNRKTQQKQSKDSAVSSRNSTPNIKVSKKQNSQRAAQFPEPAPTVAALQQADPEGTLLPAHYPQQGAERKPRAARISAFQPPDAGVSFSGKPITDPNNLWKVRSIVGRKMIRRRAHYCVEWEPTWQLESELAGIKELLDKFEAKLQNTQGQSEGGRGRRDRKAPLPAPNKLWGVRNIIGRRIIGSRKQYWVDWKPTWEPTWEPEIDLTKGRELIDEFVANNQGQRGRRGQKRSQAATEDLGVRGKSEPSKRQRRA